VVSGASTRAGAEYNLRPESSTSGRAVSFEARSLKAKRGWLGAGGRTNTTRFAR
jgi:hypothetical protein